MEWRFPERIPFPLHCRLAILSSPFASKSWLEGKEKGGETGKAGPQAGFSIARALFGLENTSGGRAALAAALSTAARAEEGKGRWEGGVRMTHFPGRPGRREVGRECARDSARVPPACRAAQHECPRLSLGRERRGRRPRPANARGPARPPKTGADGFGAAQNGRADDGRPIWRRFLAK